jgi:hypothetical protein
VFPDYPAPRNVGADRDLTMMRWGERIHELRKGGMGILKIGREVGVGTSVVQRVSA